MGLSPGAIKKMGGNSRKLALGKAVEVGKMDPPRICGILGPFPVGFMAPLGSRSQNPPGSAYSGPGTCRKNMEKQEMKSAKPSDCVPEH